MKERYRFVCKIVDVANKNKHTIIKYANVSNCKKKR